METNEILRLFAKAKSKSDVCRSMGWYINARCMRKVDTMIKLHSIDVSHFDHGASKHQKYVIVTKNCPVCGKDFTTKQGHSREKVTCSHACANTYYRSGKDNPNWNDNTYRTTCFAEHEHKCVICEEELIITVHHFDENKKNNKPENLIPLCPTHHQYWHSRYRKLIEQKVIDYRNNFISKNNLGVDP
jgi:hypothetical protein